jgi:hypothetical protein
MSVVQIKIEILKKRGVFKKKRMGNLVFKDDGFTPIIESKTKDNFEIPKYYTQLAQSYVDKLVTQHHIRNSKWAACFIDVEVHKTMPPTYSLKCEFFTLLPRFPEEYNGPPELYYTNTREYVKQRIEFSKWLSIKEESVWMKIGLNDEYEVIIYLPSLDEIIQTKDSEIELLKNMLYWSPQGEGFQKTQEHFEETKKVF